MRKTTTILKVLLIFTLIVCILLYAKSVLAPLAIAAILAMLFVGLSKKLEKRGWPRWASALLSVGILFASTTGLLLLLSWQMQSFASNIDSMKENILQLIARLQNWIDAQFGLDQEQQKSLAKEQVATGKSNSGMASSFASGFFSLLVDMILVFVYTYLLLFYRTRIKKFLIRVSAPNDQEQALEIAHRSTEVATSYMSGLAKMIVVLWLLYGSAFSLIGVENALFFAVLCGVLELVPFIGNLTGTGLTILGVIAQGGKSDLIIGVLVVYAVVQFVQTYLLEPLIVGTEVNINPLFTIISLVAAEAIWGISGMVLAIPVAGIIKIVCDTVPSLQPYGYLIGSDKKRRQAPWQRKGAEK
ncbi:AI-2E family transporter [Sphingobacterium suaedae]|uniref:AI-2E family transporter n=1 Tax=Sphingobacterium suaedae TaxID=1686402 RepID=A0ABW5KLD9_9SPHI